MSSIIKVRLTPDDQFVVTDPDTGLEKVIGSIVFHDPSLFIVDIAVKRYFLEQFPGKTECVCSADALDRIQSITDFNCLTDEVRW